MEKNYVKLDDLSAYKISSELSDCIWDKVIVWQSFSKYTIGMQFVRAVDSIAANIAEGFGRYHKKDKIKFYFNARGSTFEAIHWVKKAFKRGLIIEQEYVKFSGILENLPKEINILIKLTNNLAV